MPLPEGQRDGKVTLASAAQALGVALTDQQADSLLAYIALLAKWNRVYNLSAVRDPAEMLVRHVLDSLSVVVPLRRQMQGRPARLLDVGGGAGLPGLVLAAAVPEVDVTSIDAVGKKAAFVREAAAALGLKNMHSLHGRVEDLKEGGYDVITARAFAPLAAFVSLTSHLCGAQTVWMAMKGKVPVDEISTLPRGIDVFHVEQLAVPGLGESRCLLWLQRTQ